MACPRCGCEGLHACIGFKADWTEADIARLDAAIAEMKEKDMTDTMQPTMRLRIVRKKIRSPAPRGNIGTLTIVDTLQQWFEEQPGLGFGQLANRTKGEWRDIPVEVE